MPKDCDMADNNKKPVFFSVILLAAGSSERFLSSGPSNSLKKPFVKIAGRTLLEMVLEAFSRAGGKFCRIGEIILVVHKDELAKCRKMAVLKKYGVARITVGGKLRQDSVRNGLKLVGKAFRYILVHDTARPMVAPELIIRIMEATLRYGAAIPAVKISDTVKEVSPGGFVRKTLDRERLRFVQTPQGFKKLILEKAYGHLSKNPFKATDDSAIAESAGYAVKAIDGDPANLKITYKTDLEIVNRNFQKNRKFFC